MGFYTNAVELYERQHMTSEKLAHFRKMLLSEKTRIESDRAAYIRDEQSDSGAEESGEVSHSDSSDSSDDGANLFDRDRESAATDNMNRILAKIDRALAKIDEGTYGLSDVDGTPIPVARLEALPYAVTTIEQEESF